MFEEKNPLLLIPRGREKLHRKYFLNPYAGLQDISASAKICNRCGACAQACPSYKALAAESFSPRGRNQLLRFILDRRLPAGTPKKGILESAQSCIMCGQCSAACAAYAPAAKHMQEIKRAFNATGGGFARGILLRVFSWRPALFYALINIGRRLPGAERVEAFYMPNAGGFKHFRRAMALINKKHEGVNIIKSGLFLAETALMQSRALLAKTLDNILAEYGAVLSADPLPIIVDNIEDYRALKQSVETDEKYKILADNARFITDYMGPVTVKNKKIILQDNNIFFQDDKIPQKAAGLFVCAGDNILVHLEQGAHSAGTMPYRRARGRAAIAKNLAGAIAAQRADILILFSAREEKFFARLLKKFYPYTKALHIAAAAEYLDGK